MKGGGCNRYLGNAQIDPAFFYLGLPLLPVTVGHLNYDFPNFHPSGLRQASGDQILVTEK